MAKTVRQITLPAPPDLTYVLLRDSGNQIPKFRPSGENPAQYTLHWHRGFGWTNPIDVRAAITGYDGYQCQIEYEASILALADPFGFTAKTIEQFETHLYAYQYARQTGAPLPAPPTDERSIWINVALIGCVVVAVVLVIVVIAVLALVG